MSFKETNADLLKQLLGNRLDEAVDVLLMDGLPLHCWRRLIDRYLAGLQDSFVEEPFHVAE